MPIGGFIRRPGRRMGPPNESRERQGNIGVSIRQPLTADHDRRIDLTRTGHIRRFHSAVSEPPIKPPFQPERLKSVRYERRLETADQNRRKTPEASGHIRRFHSAARPQNETAVSPKMVKPREKPRAFSNCDHRAKIGTQGACADV